MGMRTVFPTFFSKSNWKNKYNFACTLRLHEQHILDGNSDFDLKL